MSYGMAMEKKEVSFEVSSPDNWKNLVEKKEKESLTLKANQDISEAQEVILDLCEKLYRTGDLHEYRATALKLTLATWNEKWFSHSYFLLLCIRLNSFFPDFSRFQSQFEELKEKAKQGDGCSQFVLGVIYQNGKAGIKQDYSQAKEWYEQSVENGYLPAYNNLGSLYKNGWGVEPDPERAEFYYKKAIKIGDGYAIAYYNLATIYYEKEPPTQEDYEKAFYLFEKAARRGIPIALNKLGEMYEKGEGIASDEEMAKTLYKMAGHRGCFSENILNLLKNDNLLGDPNTQYTLGVYYYKQALSLYYKDNQKRFAYEQFQLAFQYYEKAAARGHKLAPFNMGVQYFYGLGIEEGADDQLAIRCLRQAYEQGHTEAKPAIRYIQSQTERSLPIAPEEQEMKGEIEIRTLVHEEFCDP